MSSAFDRTRRWLTEFGDPDALAEGLSRTRVEFVIGADRSDAEISAALAAILLLRLDQAAPILHILGPDTRARQLPRLPDLPLVEAIASEHAGFAATPRLSTTPATGPVIRVAFGVQRQGALSVTSNGWQVTLGVDQQRGGQRDRCGICRCLGSR
jgi:hypothetical protein